jgi:hypothetical protein
VRHLSVLATLQAVATATAIAFFIGCSGGSSIAPDLKTNSQSGHHFDTHYSCPATGTIVYVSDYNHAVINVYTGKFAVQSPCGQLGHRGILSAPDGLFLQPSTLDLYVANAGGLNILVFLRGQLGPYNTYAFPPRSWHYVMDVTVAEDGTVIASTTDCYISTWHSGPNGGVFVGNFPVPHCSGGYSSWITVRRDGVIYYDDDFDTQWSAVWKVRCPAGLCGSPTRVRAWLQSPEGMAFDAAGDLLVTDLGYSSRATADTFELPNPRPKKFSLLCAAEEFCYASGMAINKRDNHWYSADWYDGAAEYAYPSGLLIGRVPVNPPDGNADGIAVDP